jgi:hypothetical protein
MTDTTPLLALPEEKQSNDSIQAAKPCRYRLTWEQARQDYEDGLLTPRGLIYYSVACRTKRLKVNVPTYCKELKLHQSTYYRAIGALKARKRLNIEAPDGIVMELPDAENEAPEAESFTVSALSQSCETSRASAKPLAAEREPSQSCESNSQQSENLSQSCESQNLKPAQGATFENAECTNRSLNTFKDQIGSSTDAAEPLNRDELGTTAKTPNPYDSEIIELLTLATTNGIQTNATISRTIAELRLQHDAAAARKIVENAISAVAEQIQRHKCKNPGGYLNAALRRGFTANGAKQARRRDHPPMQPPALNYAAGVVNQAIAQGNRGAAIAYLQTLWDSGFCDLIEEMIHLFRRDWQLSLTSQGVRDAAT